MVKLNKQEKQMNKDKIKLDNVYTFHISQCYEEINEKNKNFFRSRFIVQEILERKEDYQIELRKRSSELVFKENKTEEEHREFCDIHNKMYDLMLSEPLSMIFFDLLYVYSFLDGGIIVCFVCFEMLGEIYLIKLVTKSKVELKFCIDIILYAFEIKTCDSAEKIFRFFESNECKWDSKELITFLDENLKKKEERFSYNSISYLPYKAWEIIPCKAKQTGEKDD